MQNTPILDALQDFAVSVKNKMSQISSGEPEEQLRGPFEKFLSDDVATVLNSEIVCTGETPLPEHLGRPDFAVHRNQLLNGYAELKAPGKGVNPSRFSGHDREQFKRFSCIPNILYSDGNEWALYQNGKLEGNVVRLSGNVTTDGREAVSLEDANAIERLLRNYFEWKPILPFNRKGKIDLKGFAGILAPLCRMLKEDVRDALKNPNSILINLANDWRMLLFPQAEDSQFADAYAQTVTFALLLGRTEGADPLTFNNAELVLKSHHNLLSRALMVLTDSGANIEINTSLNLLLRVIAAVPVDYFKELEDPWLYFYEDFLEVYDPELRKKAGAYYTPIDVVRCQVKLIENLLVHRFGKHMGFADPEVVTLDPALGTGTYLLAVIELTLDRIKTEQGAGAVSGQATALAENLFGFEMMTGPYAVSELRVSRALLDRGAQLPEEGVHIYLTDTLESPHAEPVIVPVFLKPISEQHEKALQVKSNIPVIVCLGNPPYERHEAITDQNKAHTGGWVRWGDDGEGNRLIPSPDGAPNTISAILHDFLEPAKKSGYGIHLKNLYNQYIYFWRWAFWKVFEHETNQGPGIVSFITASSYLEGPGFVGVREYMRRQCDEIWILDLGGEVRGTRRDDNVFDIQTRVAIAIAVRLEKTNSDTPATIHYTRIKGTRDEKLSELKKIDSFSKVNWGNGPDDWQAPFQPAGIGVFFEWPLLTDLMPWQINGVTAGRTWVISPDKETLDKRWYTMLEAQDEDRKNLFKESPSGRKIHNSVSQLPPNDSRLISISVLVKSSVHDGISRFSFRSFDRQYIFSDARMLDRPSPELWRFHNEEQVYLASLFNNPLGSGMPLTASAEIPDKHVFRGSYGGKNIFPIYRSANALEANILPGLLELLGEEFEREITMKDFVKYVYGVLAHPDFTSRFNQELETRELRVPITKDVELFKQAEKIGAHLLWLHTYGERFIPDGEPHGKVPTGASKCKKSVPESSEDYPEKFKYNETNHTLYVGEGEFKPVLLKVFEFEVSGLKVLQSWLKYRMKKSAGRKSSSLNEILPQNWTSQFTTELLELLWVLEATVDCYPKQTILLEKIIESECFQVDEIPSVPDEMRESPNVQTVDNIQLEMEM